VAGCKRYTEPLALRGGGTGHGQGSAVVDGRHYHAELWCQVEPACLVLWPPILGEVDDLRCE
jgi:hypothetical protein